jgi:hypothetical protein
MIYKQIKEYPNYYINNVGDIISDKRLKNVFKSLTPIISKNGNGYRVVTLTNFKNPKHFMVHRLVADYFISNQHDGLQINHKDGNRLNNYYKNLEWCTGKENRLHATRILGKGIGSKNGCSKLKEIDVKNIKTMFLNNCTCKEISHMYKVSKSTIRRINKGQKWKHVI